MLCLRAPHVMSLVPTMADVSSMSRARYNGKFHPVRCLEAPPDHECHVVLKRTTAADMFVGSLLQTQLSEALDVAMKMPNVSVVAVMVVNSSSLQVPKRDAWSMTRHEVHWSTWTKFDASSYLVLGVKKAGCEKELTELFDKVFLKMKEQVQEPPPGIEYPFNAFAGMKRPAPNKLPEQTRPGPEISYYKKQRTTVQVPVPSKSGDVVATGPWDGVRQVMPEDWLLLYNYKDGVCNLHLLTASAQRKVVAQSLPLAIAELLFRVAASALQDV